MAFGFSFLVKFGKIKEMFIDLVKVKITAGRGGDGCVSFRQEKYIDKGGPDGGDGGRGGNVVFKATRNLNTLADLRLKPFLEAEDGVAGSKQKCRGRNGEDLIVPVPIGTLVYDGDRLVADLVEDEQATVVARGGDGGFGNAHFKSSTRQAPRVAEKGEAGEEYEARVELKMLADVGLVGLPNAGKSSFLSVVTSAKPEIADYQFTTLTPNLGVAYVDRDSLLIADVPGLIEGASTGKGLGINFLRHIERTSVLLHLIDAYSNDVAKDYQVIRGELDKYSTKLAVRPEIVVLTKTEGFDQELLKMQIDALKKVVRPGTEIVAISSQAKIGLEALLRKALAAVKAEKARLSIQDQPQADDSDLPVIGLDEKQLEQAWHVKKDGELFIVSGYKIEKFGRRTDYGNYQGLNRLRDIMKKMGISRELVKQGATGESKIKIRGSTNTFDFEEQAER